MRLARALVLAVAAIALGACGPAVPKLPRLDPGAIVLAFGDSLTFGTGASPAQAYPAALERMISRKVVASGVPGETSDEGLRRLPGVLDDVKPAASRSLPRRERLPSQDGRAGRGEERARDDPRSARERGIPVVLLATPKPGFGTSKVKFYEEIGQELAIPVEADVLADVLGSRSLKSDLVHPNAEGYAVIAEAVAKLLRRAGAI